MKRPREEHGDPKDERPTKRLKSDLGFRGLPDEVIKRTLDLAANKLHSACICMRVCRRFWLLHPFTECKEACEKKNLPLLADLLAGSNGSMLFDRMWTSTEFERATQRLIDRGFKITLGYTEGWWILPGENFLADSLSC